MLEKILRHICGSGEEVFSLSGHICISSDPNISRGRDYALAAKILMPLAGVSAIGSLVLFLLDRKNKYRLLPAITNEGYQLSFAFRY